jgi:RNA polymerase sigma factor for flagellar operon FliA
MEEEIAGELNLTLAEYRTRLVEVQGLTLGSLEMTIGPDTGQDLLSIIPSGDELPLATVERIELERLIAKAVEQLPEPEKLILALYYQEELTLREIGDIVNLRVSRVSELKTTSILRLRAFVGQQWPTPRGR